MLAEDEWCEISAIQTLLSLPFGSSVFLVSAFQKSTILVNSGLAAKAKWSRLEFYMLNAGTLG